MRILIRELSETLLLSLMIFIGLQFSVQNFTVEGSSMSPTLEEGRYVLVNKLAYLRLPGSSVLTFRSWTAATGLTSSRFTSRSTAR